jgi:hypothetical protein
MKPCEINGSQEYQDNCLLVKTPCSLVDDYHRFGGPFCLLLQEEEQDKRKCKTINLEVTDSYETVVIIYQSTRCHIPEDINTQEITTTSDYA